MSNVRAIQILEKGRENMIIPGSEMHELLLGKGARALDLTKAPSGHLAIEVDACGVAAEDKKEAADTEPTAGQPASSSAGAPATSDAH
eukprot:6513681-Pyramimonas_sp.AAC.1